MHRINGKFSKASVVARRDKAVLNANLLHQPSTTATRTGIDSEDTENESENQNSWTDGRRIVELDILASGLKACSDCKEPLQLSNVVQETRDGLASLLYVTCKCGVLNTVYTSKSHRSEGCSRGKPLYDVNSKCAIGMYHAGIGQTQVESFLGTIGVPSMHHKSMKRREREVLPHIAGVAQASCDMAIEEEKQALLDKETNSNIDGQQAVSAQLKYDMGWQKRGTGRSYDSPSGHGTLMGNETGKIVAYGIRIKNCRVCEYHHKQGTPVPKHNCQRNWSGSSKCMEPDVAEAVIKNVENKGLKVDTLIMDDDTTTLARVKSFKPEIIKWSDLNHTKKHLGNSLYTLAKKQKMLTKQVIITLQRWFSFAIKQNKNQVQNCRQALSQIVPHAFGEHENCGVWCRAKDNPHLVYKHKTLPQGKNLTGEQLRKDLDGIFQIFINNAEKIAPAASTKEVESFNNMVASKAPKRLHFSGSESLSSRVNCAVAQKNLGNTYVCNVNSSLGISPGRLSDQIGKKRDKKRKLMREIENSKEHKKRKLELKSKRSLDMSAKETREGTSYESSIDLVSDIQSIQEIPPPVNLGLKHITVNNNKFIKVVFDLETTSLAKDTEITQIAAVGNGNHFNQYVAPLRGISHRASEVTGLTCHGDILLLHGRPVMSLPIKESLNLFLSWLSDIGPCVLIAHNMKFDGPRLMNHLLACKLSNAFTNIVLGFCDSLPMFRKLYPGLESYKQEMLVAKLLNETYEAHNALGDVQALQSLLVKSNASDDVILSFGYSSTWLAEKEKNEYENKRNVESLKPLVNNKIVSNVIATKIGNSGLNILHLHLAFQRGGFDGLRGLFTEAVNGIPRISKSSVVIKKVSDFLEQNK